MARVQLRHPPGCPHCPRPLPRGPCWSSSSGSGGGGHCCLTAALLSTYCAPRSTRTTLLPFLRIPRGGGLAVLPAFYLGLEELYSQVHQRDRLPKLGAVQYIGWASNQLGSPVVVHVLQVREALILPPALGQVRPGVHATVPLAHCRRQRPPRCISSATPVMGLGMP